MLEDLDTLKYGCHLIFTFLVAWAVEDSPSVFIPSSRKHLPRVLVTILSVLFSSKCPELVELNFHQQQLIYTGNKEGKEPAVPAWCACVAVIYGASRAEGALALLYAVECATPSADV